ncbi:MAG: hypothetical protein DDT21_02192 [Syntrophomonadaceae bacterium]|nr:hypothetical protein [Bacillota bacterium]
MLASALPMFVPDDKRLIAAELIARINCHIVVGCFQLDFVIGEITYRAGMPFGRCQSTPEMFRTMAQISADAIALYSPFFALVLDEGASPEDVVATLNAGVIAAFDSCISSDSGDPGSRRIQDAIVTYFRQEWEYTLQDEDDSSFFINFSYVGDKGDWDCTIIADEEDEWFTCVTRYPISVPEDRHLEIAELMARVNLYIFAAGFDMDFSDGEIFCRSSICFKGFGPSPELISSLVFMSAVVADLYYPFFAAVLCEGVSPKDAAKSAEALLDEATPGSCVV